MKKFLALISIVFFIILAGCSVNGRSSEEQYQWGLKVLDDAINGVI